MFGSGLRLGVGLVNPASPGWGLGRVCLGTVCGVVPLLPAVCGVRGWAEVSACLWDVPSAPRRFRFGCAVWACVLGFWFRLRPASPWGGVGVCVCSCACPVPRGLMHPLVGIAVQGCVFVCAPRLFPAFPGWGAVCGRACWAWVSADPRLSWFGCRSVFFALLLFVGLSWFGFVVLVAGCSCPGPCGPCRPIPYLSGWAAALFLSAGCVSACFGVPFPGGPLFLAWCCRFWLSGPPVPLSGSCLRCLLGGGFDRLLWCWRAVWWLWAVLSPPPPPPPVFFFWGGGAACSSLCFPWAGARTGPHSVWSFGLLLAVAFCLGVGWAMYTLGSAPLCCQVRSWLCRLGSCARRQGVALG